MTPNPIQGEARKEQPDTSAAVHFALQTWPIGGGDTKEESLRNFTRVAIEADRAELTKQGYSIVPSWVIEQWKAEEQDWQAEAEKLSASRSQWHKFDKNDASSWPETRDEYWLTLLDEDRVIVTHGHWNFNMGQWAAVTHWMPFEQPDPPTTEEVVEK